MKVLRIHGVSDGRPTTVDDLYVHHCDVDALDGRGETYGSDVMHAMRFEDAKEAMLYWKRQSTAQPYRPDGKPNRPLSSFTVEIIDAPEDAPVGPALLIKAEILAS